MRGPGAVPVSTRVVTFVSLNLGTQLTAVGAYIILKDDRVQCLIRSIIRVMHSEKSKLLYTPISQQIVNVCQPSAVRSPGSLYLVLITLSVIIVLIFAHQLSPLQPFTPGLKHICSTNPFLHSLVHYDCFHRLFPDRTMWAIVYGFVLVSFL